MRLLFIYNANSNFGSKWFDFAHKIVSPDTYSCGLCKITHSVFKERKAWMRFRESAQLEMNFLYKDHFLEKYRSKWLSKYEYPIVLLESESDRLEVLLAAAAINEINNVDELIEVIDQRLASYND